MKFKILFAGVLMLILSACDNNEPTLQQQAPAKPDTAVVTESAKTPEAIPMEESQPQAAAEPAVAQVSAPMSGEAVYKKTCMACHLSGAAGAPKLGDKQAWKPRIEKGMDALMQSALNGVPGTSMMKRGTCLSCSDEDLRAAVEYMVEQSK
ncbi:MAG TPA: c-type cytochrome [Gammaproteobacteria bacterium]